MGHEIESAEAEERAREEHFQRLRDVAKRAIELEYGDAWEVHDHNKIRSTDTPEWLNDESQASHQICPWPNIDHVIDVIAEALEEDESRIRSAEIEDAATSLLTAVWRAIQRDSIPERGPMADAALILRDMLNPDYPSNPDWLPEPLASERANGPPNL